MLHLKLFHTPFLLPPLHNAYYPLPQHLLSPNSLSGSTSPGKWLLPSMTLIILRLTLLIHSTILVNSYCIPQHLLSSSYCLPQCILFSDSLSQSTAPREMTATLLLASLCCTGCGTILVNSYHIPQHLLSSIILLVLPSMTHIVFGL